MQEQLPLYCSHYFLSGDHMASLQLPYVAFLLGLVGRRRQQQCIAVLPILLILSRFTI